MRKAGLVQGLRDDARAAKAALERIVDSVPTVNGYGYYRLWVLYGETMGCISGADYSRPGYFGDTTVPVEYVLGECAN